MIKKNIAFVLLIICVSLFITNFKSFSSDFGDALVAEITEIARSNKPIYTKLKTCSPIKGKYMKIYGLSNNSCHFSPIEDVHCHMPMNITRQYADVYLSIINELLYNGNFNSETKENVFLNDLTQKYCDYIQ